MGGKYLNEPFAGTGAEIRGMRIFNTDKDYYYAIAEEDMGAYYIEGGDLETLNRNNIVSSQSININSAYNTKSDNAFYKLISENGGSLPKPKQSSNNEYSIKMDRVFDKNGRDVLLISYISEDNKPVYLATTNLIDFYNLEDDIINGLPYDSHNEERINESDYENTFIFDRKSGCYLFTNVKNENFKNKLFKKKFNDNNNILIYENSDSGKLLTEIIDYSSGIFPNYNKNARISLTESIVKRLSNENKVLYNDSISDFIELLNVDSNDVMNISIGKGKNISFFINKHYRGFSLSQDSGNFLPTINYSNLYSSDNYLFYGRNLINYNRLSNNANQIISEPGLVLMDSKGNCIIRTFGKSSTDRTGVYIGSIFNNFNNIDKNKIGKFLEKNNLILTYTNQSNTFMSSATTNPVIHYSIDSEFLNIPIRNNRHGIIVSAYESPYIFVNVFENNRVFISRAVISVGESVLFPINYLFERSYNQQTRQKGSIYDRYENKILIIHDNQYTVQGEPGVPSIDEHKLFTTGINLRRRKSFMCYNRIYKINKETLEMEELKPMIGKDSEGYIRNKSVFKVGKEFIGAPEHAHEKLLQTNSENIISSIYNTGLYNDRFRFSQPIIGFGYITNNTLATTIFDSKNDSYFNLRVLANPNKISTDTKSIEKNFLGSTLKSDEDAVDELIDRYMYLFRNNIGENETIKNTPISFNWGIKINEMLSCNIDSLTIDKIFQHSIIKKKNNKIVMHHIHPFYVYGTFLTNGDEENTYVITEDLYFVVNNGLISVAGFISQLLYYNFFIDVKDSGKDLLLSVVNEPVENKNTTVIYYNFINTVLTPGVKPTPSHNRDTNAGWKKIVLDDIYYFSCSFIDEANNKIILFIDNEIVSNSRYNKLLRGAAEKDHIYYSPNERNVKYSHIIIDITDLDNLSIEYVNNLKTFTQINSREAKVFNVDSYNMESVVGEDSEGKYLVHPTEGIIYNLDDYTNIVPRENQKFRTTQVIYNEKRNSWLYLSNTSHNEYMELDNRLKLPILQEVPAYEIELKNNNFTEDVINYLNECYRNNNGYNIMFKLEVKLRGVNLGDRHNDPEFKFTEIGNYNPNSFNNKIIRYVDKIYQKRDYELDSSFDEDYLSRYEKIYNNKSLFKRYNLQDRKFLDIFFDGAIKDNLKLSKLISRPLEGFTEDICITTPAVVEIIIYPTKVNFTNIEYSINRSSQNLDNAINKKYNNKYRGWVNGKEILHYELIENEADKVDKDDPTLWESEIDNLISDKKEHQIESGGIKYAAILSDVLLFYSDSNKLIIYDKSKETLEETELILTFDKLGPLVTTNALINEHDMAAALIMSENEDERGIFVYHNKRYYKIEFKDYMCFENTINSYVFDNEGCLWVVNGYPAINKEWKATRYQLYYENRNFKLKELESCRIPNGPFGDEENPFDLKVSIDEKTNTLCILFTKEKHLYLISNPNIGGERRVISHENLDYLPDNIVDCINRNSEEYVFIENKPFLLNNKVSENDLSPLNTTIRTELIDPDPIITRKDTQLFATPNERISLGVGQTIEICIYNNAEDEAYDYSLNTEDFISVEKEGHVLRITGKASGNTILRLASQRTECNESVLELNIAVISTEVKVETLLSHSLESDSIDLEIGKYKEFYILSNSPEFSVEASSENIAVEKNGRKVKIIGVSEGNPFVNIKATAKGGVEKVITITVNVIAATEAPQEVEDFTPIITEINERPDEIRNGYQKVLNIYTNDFNLHLEILDNENITVNKESLNQPPVENGVEYKYSIPITLNATGEQILKVKYKYDSMTSDLFIKEKDLTINVGESEYVSDEETPNGSYSEGEESTIKAELLKVNRIQLENMSRSYYELDKNFSYGEYILFQPKKIVILRHNSYLMVGNYMDYTGNVNKSSHVLLINKIEKKIRPIDIGTNMILETVEYNHKSSELLLPGYDVDEVNNTIKIIISKANMILANV